MIEDKTQWSSVSGLLTRTEVDAMTWIPEAERVRVASYLKYDDIYWNDPKQYALRVLDGEAPVYIPNARTVVDTTSHYLLKGLALTCENKETQSALDDFVKREVFYSRFQSAKVSGVTRGDFVFHMTADPRKAEGTRISLTAVDPGNVFPIWDLDEPDRMVGCHIATPYFLPKDEDPDQKLRIRRLTYRLVEQGVDRRRVSREEAIFELDGAWSFTGNQNKLKKVREVLPLALLDDRIQHIPIYWFKNRDWQGEPYGSSELRGIERLLEIISQSATDVSASLALEGLGVYATDGGRPVDDAGTETEWQVSPGKVMEVPQGSYFRRVEGVGSITPAVDQITYLENRINTALGLSDVALGKIDAQVAQSGIALAIKFLPTLAKVETRDQAGIDVLTQMFFNWKTWYEIFEHKTLEGDIVPTIGDKLPMDRTARVNELNNMIDRKIITRQYYRDEMESLGYKFPEDIEKDLAKEAENAILQARAAMLATKDTEGGIQNGKSEDTEGSTLPTKGNGSNNQSRPNESSGTEATQNTRDA